MKHNPQFRAFFEISLLLCPSILPLAAEEPMTPGAAKLLLDVTRAKAREPLKDFQEKYEAAITRLEEQQQAKGDLDGLVLVKKEKENFRTRKTLPEPSALAELNTLQEIYHRGLPPLQSKLLAADAAAFAAYREELQGIVVRLTREGKVEEALEAREVLTGIEEEISAASIAASQKPNTQIVVGEEENYTVTSHLTVTKKDNLYILSSEVADGELLSSARTFKTPFTLKARAMTNKNNIRLYYGQKGMIVFNWEMNRKELRIIEPVIIKRNGIPGFNPLDPDRMYDLEVKVTDSKITVYANKRKQGEVKGDFTKAEGTIGIGPARGSVVTVEYLIGIQE